MMLLVEARVMQTKYPNWFEMTAKENFESQLLPLAGKFNLRFLQIGAFTGDATVWLVDIAVLKLALVGNIIHLPQHRLILCRDK